MKSKKSVASGRNSQLKSKWNNPDVNLRLGDEFYVELQNLLVDSLVGHGLPKLRKLGELKAYLDTFVEPLNEARASGNVGAAFRFGQCYNFLRKLELPLFTEAAKVTALEKWRFCEAGCKDTNERCLQILRHPLTHSQPELDHAISVVRKEIYSLLGEFPPDLDEVARYMRFGPGSTLTHPFSEKAPQFKLLNHSCYIGMEEEVLWLAEHTLLRDTLLTSTVAGCLGVFDGEPSIEWFDEAKLDFVPKSIDEMRVIEVGPSLTGFVQQGYDGYLRELLLKWGIDLRDQRPNREMALEGSMLGEHNNSPCTIDLSSASDTISYGIVAMLLPLGWFNTLKRYRAKKIRLPDGTSVTLEKFSSMGNALTFSLQTLIFSAVVRSVFRERGWESSKWRVYGDDIIVPRRVFSDVVSRLEILGFRTNKAKSFSEGNFRESCGGDYLHGRNVRPLYLKKPIRTVPDMFKLLNLIQSFALSCPISDACFERVFAYVLRHVPRDLRIFGSPRHSLDSCIWAPHWFDDVVLRRRVESVKIPEKIRYLATLLTGYAVSHDIIKGDLAIELMDQLQPVRPHVDFALEEKASYVKRRAPARGLVGFNILPERLPFNPYVLG